MADVNSTQELTTTVERQEVLSNVAWHSFLIFMLWLGGFATLGWLVWLGYYWGSSGCYTCTQNKPTAAVVATPLVSSTQTETAAAVIALEKALMAMEEMRAQKATEASTTTASATAAATTIVSPSPKAGRQIPPTTKAEPPCQCPPEPVKAPTVDQNPPPPTPPLSFAEHRRNEMWSALRR